MREIRTQRAAQLTLPSLQDWYEARAAVDDLSPSSCELDQPVVRLGCASDVKSPSQQAALQAILTAGMPWKKGPFSLFGTEVDAEWRSDLKWERVRAALPSLTGKVIADVGCHNGYFMLRMAAEAPQRVIGIEPVPRHWLTFEWLNHLARRSELSLEMLGVEHMDLFPKFFDVIFCMGILYHHTDPVGLLRKLRAALKPGGQLVIDCQTISGEEAHALIPANRYAGARGIWFLPTALGLKHWISRAGFQSQQEIYHQPLAVEEQRTTTWAPVASLRESLDPQDPRKTIEGYPAPWRTYVIASP